MRRLPVDAGGVNESEFAVVLCLHGEADGRLLVVHMLQEAINVSAMLKVSSR